MNTQKNTILPSTPNDIDSQLRYNNELKKTITDVIKDIAIDLDNIDKRLKVLEP